MNTGKHFMILQIWLSCNVWCDSQVSLTEIQIGWSSSKMSPSMECFHSLHIVDRKLENRQFYDSDKSCDSICRECWDNLSSQATSLFVKDDASPHEPLWNTVTSHCRTLALSPLPFFSSFFLSSDWFKNASASIDFTSQSLPRHPTPARPGHVL